MTDENKLNEEILRFHKERFDELHGHLFNDKDKQISTWCEICNKLILEVANKARQQGMKQILMHINKHQIGEIIDEMTPEETEKFFVNILSELKKEAKKG